MAQKSAIFGLNDGNQNQIAVPKLFCTFAARIKNLDLICKVLKIN